MRPPLRRFSMLLRQVARRLRRVRPRTVVVHVIAWGVGVVWLIPFLGVMSCTYLMTELGIINWTRFGIWLAVGLVIYFAYGYRNSKLRSQEVAPAT